MAALKRNPTAASPAPQIASPAPAPKSVARAYAPISPCLDRLDAARRYTPPVTDRVAAATLGPPHFVDPAQDDIRRITESLQQALKVANG